VQRFVLALERFQQNQSNKNHPLERRLAMLWTIFVILLVLWLLGMVSSYTLGGYVHLLLVVAVVVVLIRLIQGRSPV
jgi:hypothetical protein